jgi:hypothetical protein
MTYLIIGLLSLALGEAIIIDLSENENKIKVIKKASELKW